MMSYDVKLISGLILQPFVFKNVWSISNKNETSIYVLFCSNTTATTGYATTSVRVCNYNAMALQTANNFYMCQRCNFKTFIKLNKIFVK